MVLYPKGAPRSICPSCNRTIRFWNCRQTNLSQLNPSESASVESVYLDRNDSLARSRSDSQRRQIAGAVVLSNGINGLVQGQAILLFESLWGQVILQDRGLMYPFTYDQVSQIAITKSRQSVANSDVQFSLRQPQWITLVIDVPSLTPAILQRLLDPVIARIGK